MKTCAQLKEEGFILTDNDSNQWVKKLSRTRFLVYEKEREFDIELIDYSEKELDELCRGFYTSYSELWRLNGEFSFQIIAEIIAELKED